MSKYETTSIIKYKKEKRITLTYIPLLLLLSSLFILHYIFDILDLLKYKVIHVNGTISKSHILLSDHFSNVSSLQYYIIYIPAFYLIRFHNFSLCY